METLEPSNGAVSDLRLYFEAVKKLWPGDDSFGKQLQRMLALHGEPRHFRFSDKHQEDLRALLEKPERLMEQALLDDTLEVEFRGRLLRFAGQSGRLVGMLITSSVISSTGEEKLRLLQAAAEAIDHLNRSFMKLTSKSQSDPIAYFRSSVWESLEFAATTSIEEAKQVEQTGGATDAMLKRAIFLGEAAAHGYLTQQRTAELRREWAKTNFGDLIDIRDYTNQDELDK